MVLIIQPWSEQRWVVNEKYTDSDLFKVSLQMTELTNSSQGAESAGRRGSRYTDGVNILSVCILKLTCWMDADGVRKVTVVAF